jgi:hypothetical protein
MELLASDWEAFWEHAQDLGVPYRYGFAGVVDEWPVLAVVQGKYSPHLGYETRTGVDGKIAAVTIGVPVFPFTDCVFFLVGAIPLGLLTGFLYGSPQWANEHGVIHLSHFDTAVTVDKFDSTFGEVVSSLRLSREEWSVWFNNQLEKARRANERSHNDQ